MFSFTPGTLNSKQLVTDNILPVDLLGLKACLEKAKKNKVGQISFSTTYLNARTGVRQILETSFSNQGCKQSRKAYLATKLNNHNVTYYRTQQNKVAGVRSCFVRRIRTFNRPQIALA